MVQLCVYLKYCLFLVYFLVVSAVICKKEVGFRNYCNTELIDEILVYNTFQPTTSIFLYVEYYSRRPRKGSIHVGIRS